MSDPTEDLALNSISDSDSGPDGRPTAAIHPATTIGRVALYVRDLDRSVEFYTTALGLVVHHMNDETAQLGASTPGAGTRELLRLQRLPNAQKWPTRGYAGLYHFALLFPSRVGLADALRRLVENHTPLEGASDHGVSEAIYLRDPDGHGIELYRDRPRAQWPVVNGSLQMVSDPLDLYGILGEVGEREVEWEGVQPGTRMGHIHLHTADLNAAQAFYGSVLGFDLMQRYGGSALFMSAGGYHHHLGLNLWAGSNVPPAPDNVARLGWYEIVIPADLDRVVARCAAHGHAVTPVSHEVAYSEHKGAAYQVIDSAGLAVRLVEG